MRYNGGFSFFQREAVLFLHPVDKRIYVQLRSQPSFTSCLLSSVRQPNIYWSTKKACNHSPVRITTKYKSLVWTKQAFHVCKLGLISEPCPQTLLDRYRSVLHEKKCWWKKEIKNQRKKMWMSHIYKRLLYRYWSKLESSCWWRGQN